MIRSAAPRERLSKCFLPAYINASLAPGDGGVSQVMDDFLPFDPPSGRPRSCTPLDSPPPVKRIREGLYPVSRRTAVTSGVVSRRSGVPGVPSRQPSFPQAGTSTAQMLASRDLPPVPAPTPEPRVTVDPVLRAPLGGQDPPPNTSQWVCLLYTSPSPRD